MALARNCLVALVAPILSMAVGCAPSDSSADLRTTTDSAEMSAKLFVPKQGPPCPLGLGADATPAACYGLSVITALSTAHLSIIEPDTAGMGTNLLALATEALYAGLRHRRGIEDAVRTIQPFVSSSDSLVSKSAKNIVTALSALHDISLDGDSVFRQQVDNPGAVREGSAAAGLAELRGRRHAAGMLLGLGIAAVAHALLQPDPSSDRSMLAMTASEKEVLLRAIVEGFPSALKRKRSGFYSSDYAGTITLLDGFLRQDWKTRNDHPD